MFRVTVEYKPRYRIRKGSIAEAALFFLAITPMMLVIVWEISMIY